VKNSTNQVGYSYECVAVQGVMYCDGKENISCHLLVAVVKITDGHVQLSLHTLSF